MFTNRLLQTRCRLRRSILALLGLIFSQFASAQEPQTQMCLPNTSHRNILQSQPYDTKLWWFPNTGILSGNYEINVAMHFWDDFFVLRNLQLRTQLNILKGLKINYVIRSNHDLEGIKNFDPFFDELYLEHYGYYLGERATFSYSARVGRIRYLRFPFPDNLSIFDIVPRIFDLSPWNKYKTSYDGLVVSLDYKLYFGLGYHACIFQSTDGNSPDLGLLENYVYFQDSYRALEWELRGGQLQARTEPQGASAWGANAYVGVHWRGIRVGFMAESQQHNRVYAGILVQFSPTKLTNFLGEFHSDYTRTPQGIAMQVPLVKGTFGYTDPKDLPQDAELVGEVVSERRSTFWQNSQTRNFYEHQLSLAGDVTSDSLYVVADEYSWYLKNESPVGITQGLQNFQDLKDWNATSARLGEVAQPVVYRYYRIKGSKLKRKFVIAPGIDPKSLMRVYPDKPSR